MTTTSNLGLTTFSEASGSATTFLAYRLAIAGLVSNMSLIDTFAGWTSASTTTIRSLAIHTVAASYISANYYEATVATITGYNSNLLINLKLNTSITGSTIININSYGNKDLKKVDIYGSLVNLESGDLKVNRFYLFQYNGTYFVLIGSQIGDQISISGSSNRLVSISGSGILIDSGISASSITTTGMSGSRTFYSASATGGAVTTLNTVNISNGAITSWTQT